MPGPGAMRVLQQVLEIAKWSDYVIMTIQGLKGAHRLSKQETAKAVLACAKCNPFLKEVFSFLTL